jgi:KDO2-lipid IV(A) lauroyltransferase
MIKRLRRFFAYPLAYASVKVLMVVASVVPRRQGTACFARLGMLAYLLLGKSRRVALANLRLIYGSAVPDKEIRAMARRAFENLGRFGFDVARLKHTGMCELDGIVEVTGLDHMDAALARGKGVIALTGHVGNWELLGAYLSFKGYRINVMARDLKDSRLNDLVLDLRRSTGLTVLERSSGVRQALRCLRRGEVLGLLIDQDTSVDSVVVDFLGRPAKTAVGPVRLARHTGAAIVPLAMMMTDRGGYRIEVTAPIFVSADENMLSKEVERCSKAVEAFIRAAPEQWVWMHKRWKSLASEMYS